ncbi:MAG: PEP/pyruvate-binding domain-containing protein [Solirubrobacterales bacterium]
MNLEKVSTGIGGLDEILDWLRLGDNVVWQVDSIHDYRYFVRLFVENALRQRRRVVYLRFGQHDPVVPENSEVVRYDLDPNQGFEMFSMQVNAIASQEGEGVFYVFDSLSDLLSVWATDLMIGNFFRVTCPYLFELDTIAYFAVLRHRNSHQTIARIRETTQLMLDVSCPNGKYCVHPLKVWNRYSPTMFLPHVESGEKYEPVTSSVEAARLFAHIQFPGVGTSGRKLDYWDRVILRAEEMLKQIETGHTVIPETMRAMIDQLCRMMIGREERVLGVARDYLSLKDLLQIKNRLIGTGYIGGKTVGMLLARNILRDDPRENWRKWMEPHDSFYIGSDVYYTYLVENGCWKLLLKQKQPEHYFSAAAELREKIQNGKFPVPIQEQFMEMLDYYGQAPIIVRSSSLLEDGFGNAFAGKYDSVFCVNQADPQERYLTFERAVKQVFASTMSEDALAYRQQRGLAQMEEQMALLVQRVSGAHRGRYYFPDLAGVAMSRNLYVWREGLDSEAGMMRLVMGLGTRAVDRVEDDHPRIVPLDQPLVRPEATLEEKIKYSQRKVDLLDMAANREETEELNRLQSVKNDIRSWDLIASVDYHASNRMRELGLGQELRWYLSFDRLLGQSPFAGLMQKMLKTLEQAYQYPVDVEFTVNFDPDHQVHVNLLQCRPMQTGRRRVLPQKERVQPARVLFATNNGFMGGEVYERVGKVIYVDPDAYGCLSERDKYETARLVGRLNRLFADRKQDPFVLIGPGRWGTSTPSLGVPVSFAEICNTLALVELAGLREGYMPEVSFGTHFFQDLVETDIFYVALYPGREGVAYAGEWLKSAPNVLPRYLPEADRWTEIIKVIEFDPVREAGWLDIDLEARRASFYTVQGAP